MRRFRVSLLPVLMLVGFAGFSHAEETAAPAALPEFPKPTKEHQWLEQLVGEWEATSEMYIDEKTKMTGKGTESIRSLGGFWIVSTGTGSIDGMPGENSSQMTLGYDPEKKRYVGTWVDSMQSYLWEYEGAVDESGKKLILETRGACPGIPGKTSNFRETITITGKDTKLFTSEMQEDDGKWTLMVKMESTRKK